MPDPERRKRAVSFIIKSRTDRKKFFPAALFSEPAWDMLLKLYAAAVDRRPVTLDDLAKAANVQLSTAERWVAALDKEHLVTGRPVKGGDAVSLSAKGWLAMDSYFENMSSGQI
jgi:hypothetical protein